MQLHIIALSASKKYLRSTYWQRVFDIHWIFNFHSSQKIISFLKSWPPYLVLGDCGPGDLGPGAPIAEPAIWAPVVAWQNLEPLTMFKTKSVLWKCRLMLQCNDCALFYCLCWSFTVFTDHNYTSFHMFWLHFHIRLIVRCWGKSSMVCQRKSDAL